MQNIHENSIDTRLVLKIRFTRDIPSEDDQKRISEHLAALSERLYKEGLLSGDTPFEVESYEHSQFVGQPGHEPLEGSVLSSFFADRIENGELSPEDIPAQMARYGLQDPAVFQQEMLERMEMAQFGRFSDSADDSGAHPVERR